jgi:hypothetical protein
MYKALKDNAPAYKNTIEVILKNKEGDKFLLNEGRAIATIKINILKKIIAFYLSS